MQNLVRILNLGDRLTRGGCDVDIVKGNMGWIEVIVGPMFSGKSEELIRRLRRAEYGKQRVQIFKPAIDQRYAKNGIVSHSGLEIPSELIGAGTEIMDRVAARTEVVGIDEAQFLGEGIVDALLEARGTRQARDCGRTGHRFHGADRLSRCRGCWQWPRKSRSFWRSACAAGIQRFTRNGWWRRRN